MNQRIVISLLAGLYGLIIGSFLNVVVFRLPRGQSLVRPPSRCPNCGTTLKWYDNVPVLGWLVLRGRCRHCHTKFSAQYPIVEFITGALFVLIAWLTPDVAVLARDLLLVCILIVLFGIDLEHQILPNSITLPGIVIGLMFSAITPPGWKDALIGTLLGGGLLYGIAEAYYFVRKEEGLGMGDVKMLAMIGAFLGWKAVLVTLALSSFSGALVGVGLIATQRTGMRVAMPFGTFLALGALAAMLVGDPLIAWYAQFF